MKGHVKGASFNGLNRFTNSELLYNIWAVTLMGVDCSLCLKRLGLSGYHILITLHDVMFVLLCSLIMGAAVQSIAAITEGDAQVTEVHIPGI